MTLREGCERIYGMLKRRITPGLKHSQDTYAAVLRRHVDRRVAWLDVGCGHQVLPDWHAEDEKALVDACKMVVGVDADLRSLVRHRTVRLRVKADISCLPFKNECFDLVTANMVIEHLREPGPQSREISRVLKPGGHCILVTPNAYGYPTILARCVPDMLRRRLVRVLDTRKATDVFRSYYRANTEQRIRAVAEASSLDVVQIAMVTTDAVLAVIPPLAGLELLWIRLLMTKPFRRLRPDLVATLRKSECGAPGR
jgi:2-polyprenyl-3-methyl-5-hydroxy-6-metoxy-1,4-benzoquinol methylase